MRDEIHLNDLGTLFTAIVKDGDAKALLQTATTLEFFAKPPIAAAKTWTAGLRSGTNNVVDYTIQASDLDEAGGWQLQLHVIAPSGEWRSNVLDFTVHANLA